MYDLSEDQFRLIADRVYDFAKINLSDRKRSLVIARLSKRIRRLGLNGFDDYIELLEDEESGEFQKMVNAISTNYSHFFREPYHFDFLTNTVLPNYTQGDLNLWSAASSTGQEIYSILVTIKEFERVHSCKIRHQLYGSDISSEVLTTACRGIFPRKDIDKIDPGLLKRYFLSGTGDNRELIKVKRELIKQIQFYKINLMDSIFHLPKMDVIFLRNVLIYFDHSTKVELIEKLYYQLKPGGYLFIGHSESLSGISQKFKVAGKTIYQRIEQ